MGSSKKKVNGASFSNTYNQNNKPKELLINRLVQDNTGGRKIGSLKFDDRLLGIVSYTKSITKFVKVTGAISESFDPEKAMQNSVNTTPYTIVSSQVEDTTPENIIKSDYMITKSPTVSLDSYTNNVDDNNNVVSYNYTLSDGTNSTVGATSRSIHSVTYTHNGQTNKYFTFSNTSYGNAKDSGLKFFMESIKEDGKKLPNRESYRTMYRMGTTVNSFSDAFKNNELKDLYYTYSAKSTNPDAIEFTNSIVSDNITIQIDGNSTLEITKKGNGWITLYDGTEVKDEDGDDVIVLPLNAMDKLSISDKYIFVKKHLGYLSFSQKEVKVEWYQTGFFKFLLGAVLGVYGLFTGNFIPLEAYLGSLAVGYVFKNSSIGQVVGALLSFWTGGFIIDFTISGVMNALNLASTFFSIYVKYEYNSIIDKTNAVEKKVEHLKEQIAKYSRQFLYSPLDKMPYLYTLTYNAYEELYNPLDKIKQQERSYFGY